MRSKRRLVDIQMMATEISWQSGSQSVNRGKAMYQLDQIRCLHLHIRKNRFLAEEGP
jgi:hypothetical protein